MGDDGKTGYHTRTDGAETILALLRDAEERGEFRLALALTDSLKDRLEATWRLGQTRGALQPHVAASAWRPVADLPAAWARWAAGWEWYQAVGLAEPEGLVRTAEPVDLLVAAPAAGSASLRRELRVAHVHPDTGALHLVPSQVYGEERVRAPAGEGEESGTRTCHLVWQVDAPARGEAWYLLFCGNPAAELPEYVTDLATRGEGFALDVENAHYAASLSRQMGQLERLRYKRAHGLELFAGGEGHGEPPGIDWAHDYLADDKFQKFRVTNWATCRNYEVIRGPVCTIVRRWGFPHSPLHPVFTAARLFVDVTYVFYAGLPYFVKRARMEAVQDFALNYLRDDEWVFSGYSFTDVLWMDAGGRMHEGAVPPEHAGEMWGVGFFNGQSRDAFCALRLEHRLEGPSASPGDGAADSHRPVLHHADAPTLNYRRHGQLWSRWALRGDPHLRAGDTLLQRNAYFVEPYDAEDGAARLERWRRQLLHPLAVRATGQAPASLVARAGQKAEPGAGTLARIGEDAAAGELKQAIWAALREVPDDMFYTANASVADLGYVYDVRLRDGRVEVLLTMPHRGRPHYLYLGNPIAERLRAVPGVSDVVITPTWDPPWTPDCMSDAGWAAMELPETGSQ